MPLKPKIPLVLAVIQLFVLSACADTAFHIPPQPDSTPANIEGRDVHNVILCIGDGMGTNHIAMARDSVGDELYLERLPVVGLVRTYSADSAVTDSAAAATAMACGIKTNNGMLGMSPEGATYATILELMRDRGWRSGLVVTSTISHATPAGFAAHVSSRANEEEIARQMSADRVDVLFGGGRKYWLPAGRNDGENLIEQAKNAGYQIIDTRQQLSSLGAGPAIGLFADDGLTTAEPEPSLAQMAAAAIKLLSAKNKGWFAPKPKFFIMIEGSQIDWAAHKNNTEDCIRQTLLFDMAVKEAIDFARMDRHTLVIVTADHETGGLVLKKTPLHKNPASPIWTTKDHTAASVPLFALGPGSTEFAGTLDNTQIPQKIAALVGISPFPRRIKTAHPPDEQEVFHKTSSQTNVDEYAIHKDGGIIYNPLEREARKTGQSERYKNVDRVQKRMNLDGYHLSVSVPRQAMAYDIIPISYELTWDKPEPDGFPAAVEAVAFEQDKRRKGDCFDLALPGCIDLDIEYLGSITAHIDPNARHNLNADFSDTPRIYPPFTRKPMVKSGAIEAGDLIWFKFRYTNTGNTILDPEGFGGCQFWPRILRRNEQGQYDPYGEPYNLYARDLEYLYPGESREMWFHCTGSMPGYSGNTAELTPQGFGLIPGEYKFQFRMTYRDYSDDCALRNIWNGPQAFIWEMPFAVEDRPRQAPIASGMKTLTNAGQDNKITTFIHTFEEFMTSFDCHLKAPDDGSSSIKGALNLQVAPWTEHVVIKLIAANPVRIATVVVPVTVKLDSLAVRFNPDSRACMVKNGMSVPIIASQTMADMRTNVQIGPFPEKHIRSRLKEMQDCGVNMVATTCMPWLYQDKDKPAANYEGDALKYVLDVCRKEGMAIEGIGAYPYDRSAIRDIAGWVTGRQWNVKVVDKTHYPGISFSDPLLPPMHASVWKYQFDRWGDLYYQTIDGHVPVSTEDSRGWMRQDINIRYLMSDSTIAAFRQWAKAKYQTIKATNSAWQSNYQSFEEIDPQKNQNQGLAGHRWEYTNKDNVFHDWSPAVLDLDQFRTELRVKNYQDTLALIREHIPGASIDVRTEGGNVMVSGLDPQTPNLHFRHIYYSQRRCALIADLIQKSKTVSVHSDYTTVPYTPGELRFLVRKAVGQGVIPVYYAQFDNMRDIAINTKYGTEYGTHYNLPESRKGYMMHVLTAVYPWFRAMYEEGGVPGILWEDYQCDGFATETQKREMKLFANELKKAISTPDALKIRTLTDKAPSQAWRKKSRALNCYNIED